MKIIRKEFIMAEPTPTPQCHASTLELLHDGTVISSWFGGTKEGENDVGIWVSRRENGIWSAPALVSPERDIPHFNPVLYLEADKTLNLFYKVGYNITDWKTMVMKSRDGGKTWSDAAELVPGDCSGGRGPVKNKPIRISNGKILAPASTEQGPWRCFIDMYCEKDGWQKKHIPVSDADRDINVIQPTLWENPAGHIHALMRSNKAYLCESHSEDFGETWSEVTLTNIPNNNSGVDCVLTENGKVVLVCNPVAKHAGPRTPLSVLVSDNNGKSFERVMDLETAEGEYSYPAIVSKGNKVYITYTYKRENIVFCELEL